MFKNCFEIGLAKGQNIKTKVKVKKTIKKIEGEVISIQDGFIVVKTENYNTSLSLFDLQNSKVLVV